MQQRVGRLVEALCEDVERVLDPLPGSVHRPQELARVLGINVTLASRLLSALRAEDSLEAAYAMPGPEALRAVMTAAAAHGTPAKVVRQARTRIQAFDLLIRDEFGGRSALEALIADGLPSAGVKFQVASRQGMFKAASNLKGAQAEVSFSTALVLPSDDPMYCSAVFLGGYLGLRRLRPGAPVRLQVTMLGPSSTGQHGFRTINGEPIDAAGCGALVEEFCSSPVPRIEICRGDGTIKHVLADDRVGVASSADVIFGERLESRFRRYQPEGTHERIRRAWIADETEIPCKVLILDLLLAPQVWPACTPELRVYDTVIRGTALPNDPERDADRMPIEEAVRPLGVGLRRFRASEIPRYVQMIQGVCDTVGCDARSLRGYRVRIRYPFYGSQTMILVDPPIMGDVSAIG